MKNTELRIGNWVEIIQHKKGSYTTIQPSCFSVDIDKTYKAIHLTEDWLLKFGFEKIIYDSEETGYGVDYHLDLNSKTKMVICEDFSFGIENTQLDTHWLSLDFDKFNGIHHLQNIWYALTNKELTIKQ